MREKADAAPCTLYATACVSPAAAVESPLHMTWQLFEGALQFVIAPLLLLLLLCLHLFGLPGRVAAGSGRD